MALKLRFYRCKVCGNIVQVFIEGAGELVCCGEEMELLEAKTADIGSEKHVPVFEILEDGTTVIKVGSEPHPMESGHYIQFIETTSKDNKKIELEFFEPDQIAQMKVKIDSGKAFEYCNIHSLWEGNND